MVRIVVALFVAVAAALPVQAQFIVEQQVVQTTNNVFDLNPQRDALDVTAGRLRIKHAVTDGVDPLDLDGGYPIPLIITDRQDDFRLATVNSVSGAPPNEVWWVIQNLGAGEYDLTATVTFPDDTFQIFHRYVTVTNVPVSDIINVTNTINVGETSVTNIFNEGTFQTTVTNDINVAGVVVTNTTIYEGDFSQTIITNLVDQFVGVNVFTPDLASTNVSGTWTVDLTTNAAVSIYEQTGNITSVVFNVDSTNDVALGQVLLLATTNAITWPTNGLTWAAGSEPTTVSNQYNRIYFEAWRDAVFGVYVGATP